MAEEASAIKHYLVPEHVRLEDDDKNRFLERYNLSIKQLPKILISDPALVGMEIKIGDIIKIKRKSDLTQNIYYYRVVVDG